MNQPLLKKEIGIFLYADYFNVNEFESIKIQMQKYFTIIKSENITANVYHAIKIDGSKRIQKIISTANCIIKPLLSKLNVNISDDLKNKKKIYYVFVLQKREDVDILDEY